MALALGIALGVRGASGCGDFRMPSNHFEGVSSQGYVSIWKQLDTLDLGDARVPILLGAQTYRKIPSGELGSGWIMPLFDSGIVQRDENTFDMITPDGTMDFFYRDGTDPNILLGSSGWTAEIQGSDIIVHSKCGSGWKMVFRQGKLDTLSKGNHELRIQRDPLNRPTGITENGVTRLALTRDEKTGLVSALEMNKKKYLFEYEGKPKVENVLGQNMVGGVEPSLHKITNLNVSGKEGGKSESYDFAVTEKMLPNLKITDTEGKERLIVWGLNGMVLQDAGWAYKIVLGNDSQANASIERSNAQKQKESWFKDDDKGIETIGKADGSKIVQTWFTTGLLAGKPRSKQITKDGVTKKIFAAVYDEKANQIRVNMADGTTKQFQYTPEGKRLSMVQSDKNGKTLQTVMFDEHERLSSAASAQGRKEEVRYDDKTHQKLTYIDGKLLYEQYLDPGKRWMQRVVYDTKTGNRKLSVWKEFNAQGRLVLDQISDTTGKMLPLVKQYTYDNTGKVVKEINSRLGTISYSYIGDGKVIKKLLKPASEKPSQS